jgi:hypothetical protein
MMHVWGRQVVGEGMMHVWGRQVVGEGMMYVWVRQPQASVACLMIAGWLVWVFPEHVE